MLLPHVVRCDIYDVIANVGFFVDLAVPLDRINSFSDLVLPINNLFATKFYHLMNAFLIILTDSTSAFEGCFLHMLSVKEVLNSSDMPLQFAC